MKDPLPKFIQIEDKLVNLQFIKSVRLFRGVLEVTVPEPGGGETTHMIHERASELFERLKSYSINYSA